MKRRWTLGVVWLAVVGAAALGCDTSEGPAPQKSGSDAGTQVDTTTGDTTVDQDGAVAPPTVKLKDFEQYCSPTAACANEAQSCNTIEGEDGLCVAKPKVETTISDPFEEESTDKLPDLSCVGQAWPAPTGKKVRLHGIVDRFGSGPVTTDITIKVFDAAKFHPEKCLGMGPADTLACYQEIYDDKDSLLGTAVSTPVDKGAESDDCQETKDCPLGYECNDTTGFLACHEQFGLYEIKDMPTNTPVVVMTQPSEDEMDSWHRTFLFHVVFLEEFAQGDDYRYDPTIVGDGQWKTVPNPFNTQIKAGNGAIGGRVRDCATAGDAGRASWYIYEATVGFGNEPSKIGYFNELEEDTLPVPSRSATNILGRYAGLDVVPGPNVITGTVLQDGKLVSLGSYPIYVFPSGLSIVSFPGAVPAITHE